MKKHGMAFGLAMFLVGAGAAWAADPGTLTVRVDQPGVKISPMLYGLMTEEINHSYDGGLYGELIQNRTFKDSDQTPVHWSTVASGGASGTIALDYESEQVNATALNVSMKLDITDVAAGQRVGVANDGFWGIPVKPNTTYRASFYARASEGFSGPLTVAIESNDGTTVAATGTVAGVSGKWQKYTVALKTGDLTPSTTNRFVIAAASKGTVWFNLVSLFPPTFNNRPNGNRIDLMQKLGDMKPAFLRLPGGNYLEGDFIDDRFAWKKTIGPLEDRPGHQCPWGYRSSDGMGLLEYLEWCEDLKMEPILAVYAGYSLRGQRVSAGPDLKPFVQEGMDEIEYVTGSETTKWGAERAKDGHAAPFKLTYVEVGNEDFFDGATGSYDRRFAQFYDAIRAKYPKLQIIATSAVKSRVPDVVDDHYYRSARDMERDVHHYDNTDRNGPKIFVGEWATTEGNPTPTMNAALGDAAWMTGMERNSDVVVIASYAPLLVNVNKGAAQWGTNLIGYDAMNSFGSPSYYAQKMFAENRGDTVLPVELVSPPAPDVAVPAPTGRIGVGTWATVADYKDIKVTKLDGKTVLYEADISNGVKGWKGTKGDWKPTDEGTLQQASGDTDCHATTGDVAWTDYVYSLKARKTSGNEGFLILFHVKDDDNYIWWNVGGWGDTRTQLEKAENGARSPLGESSDVKVDNDHWYDIRVEVKGRNIKCYLDGNLVTEATDAPAAGAPTMYATASRVDATGEVVVKLVNTLATAQPMAMTLEGVAGVASGTAEVLAGEPGDVNTLAEPEKVAPKKTAIANAGPKFVYEAAGHSVSVIRLKVQ